MVPLDASVNLKLVTPAVPLICETVKLAMSVGGGGGGGVPVTVIVAVLLLADPQPFVPRAQ